MLDNLLENRSQNMKIRFYSKSLDKEMESLVYLPKNYHQSKSKRYPVLYLLHGFSGNKNTMLIQHGIDDTLDQLIDESVISPLIVVAPYYEGSYGINSANKTRIWHQKADGTGKRYEGRYEDFLIKDLISYIEKNFSADTDRVNRYIGGWSMGGYASMHISFRNPHLFSKCAGIGSGIQKPHINQLVYSWLYPNEEARYDRDPLLLAQYKDISENDIYLNCGKDDPFFDANHELADILRSRGLKITFKSNIGGHNAKYLHENLEDFILFFGKNESLIE
jgi:enterochelin esterase-like enzyme